MVRKQGKYNYVPKVKEGECTGCHIFIGYVEEQQLIEYEGHLLCSHCITEWQRRNVPWEKFVHG